MRKSSRRAPFIPPLVSEFCKRQSDSPLLYPNVKDLSNRSSERKALDLRSCPIIKDVCCRAHVGESLEIVSQPHGIHSIYLADEHLRKLSIFLGDWVCVIVRQPGSDRILGSHIAVAKAADGHEAVEHASVSRIFGYHLKGNHFQGRWCPAAIDIIALPTLTGPCTRHDNIGNWSSASGHLHGHTTSLGAREQFKIAKQCRLSRVKSPSSSEVVDYSEELREYFSRPVVLEKGEIIEIISDGGDERMKTVVYFKVVELEERFDDTGIYKFTRNGEELFCPQTMIVSCQDNETALELEGAVKCFVPPPVLVGTGPADIPLAYNADIRQKMIDVFLPQLYSRVSKLNSPSASVLLCGGRGSGKRQLVDSVGHALGLHVKEFNCRRELLKGGSDVGGQALSKSLSGLFQSASDLAPCMIHIRRFRAVAPTQGQSKNQHALTQFVAQLTRLMLKAHTASLAPGGLPVLFVATCEESDDVEAAARACFTHEFSIMSPDDKAREMILNSYLRDATVADDVIVKDLIKRTAGRSCSELKALVSDAGKHSFARFYKSVLSSREVQKGQASDGRAVAPPSAPTIEEAARLEKEDFENAIKSMEVGGSSPGATASIPNVKWDDVGGLGKAKDEVMDMITLPLKHPELFAKGMKQRSGVLFYGPPGTGKTLLAKAVATECNCNFISVKGPELLNMYIGESEKNVRQVFERARAAKPCVLFFDEIDSLAPARGKGSDSGGVMDRVVSQLLTEIDGMSGAGGGDLFVIGATNRPDLLDSSLLRPGRFDRLLYLGIAADHPAQLKILQALTRKFVLEDDVNLLDVIKSCPGNYTGADFYALASNALSFSIKRRAKGIMTVVNSMNEKVEDSKKKMTIPKYLQSLDDEALSVKVGMEDFMKAREGIVASVSEEEHLKYLRLKEEYSPSDGATV
jgi:SpoVK/Ycf46/Vps4 family AAA+-type ATPase